MFDDLINDFKRPNKALRSTKTEEYEVIIFEIRINFHRKTAVIVAGDFPIVQKITNLIFGCLTPRTTL